MAKQKSRQEASAPSRLEPICFPEDHAGFSEVCPANVKEEDVLAIEPVVSSRKVEMDNELVESATRFLNFGLRKYCRVYNPHFQESLDAWKYREAG